MELTREALAGVKFRTRGQWYDARQVDRFIDELTVALDQSQREEEERRRALEAEVKAAREEARALAEAEKAAPAPEEGRRRVCRELEAERDQLIADIKALRRFRESFRQAVERDARGLLEKLGTLESEQLLKP